MRAAAAEIIVHGLDDLIARLTATGATVEGDALEQNVAKGATAHTIHVSGDVVCGTTTGG